MSNEIKVFSREAFFIKKSLLKPAVIDAVNKKYTLMFYEEKACQKCEWLEDRHGPTCDNCPAFKGGVNLAKDVKIGTNTYLSLPAGDLAGIRSALPANTKLKVVSKHGLTKMKRPIRFTGELKPTQREAVDAIKSKKRGVVKAPPRSGKTVLSSAAACEIGRKTLIMAAQRDWLDGFYETFCGSDTQKPLTNARKDQVGFANTYEQFKKYDVCLATCQTFRSEKGKKLLRRIRDMFDVIIVDEVHMAAATQFATALSRLNAKYKIGLSGTPNRKDTKYVIAEKLIGPVIYDAKVKRLRPTIRLVRTKYKRHYKGNVHWTTMVSSLEKDPARLKLIAEWAWRDIKQGHMVLIPLSQVAPIKALAMAINRIAGKRVAHVFYGGVKKELRKDLIQRARTYKVRCLVGNTKLLSTGINIPRASMLYDVAMSSNKENCEQRVSRILTEWEDKPPPTLRIYLDDMNVRRRCLSNEWWQCIVPKFKPIVSDVDMAVLKAYMSTKDSAAVPAWEL